MTEEIIVVMEYGTTVVTGENGTTAEVYEEEAKAASSVTNDIVDIKPKKDLYDLIREYDNTPPSRLKEGAVLEDIIKTFAPNFYNGEYQRILQRYTCDLDTVMDWLSGYRLGHPEDDEARILLREIKKNLEYDARSAFRRNKKIYDINNLEKRELPAPIPEQREENLCEAFFKK